MSPVLPVQARHQPWLVRYCAVALVFTTFVLFAGAFTTSIHAGMAFKDWPLSNGSLNPPGWPEDKNMRAEHSHRLLAESVGFLALGAMVWILRTEKRRWIRRLSVAECMRLQSMPFDYIWPRGTTQTNAYKIVGNGWSCRVGHALQQAIAAVDPDARTVASLFCGVGLADCGWRGRFT